MSILGFRKKVVALIHPGDSMTQIEVLNPVLEDEDLGIIEEDDEELEGEETEDGEEKKKDGEDEDEEI